MLPKIIIIGWDSATWEIINPMLKKGKLPNFKKILDKSAYCRLQSTVAPISVSSWTSFLTGKQQGKHGIYNWLKKDLKKYIDRGRLIDSRDIDSKTFIHYLNANGIEAGIINIHNTYPPLDIEGWQICGLPRPSFKEGIFPVELKNRPEIIKNRIEPMIPFDSLKSERYYLNYLKKNDNHLTNLMIEFMKNESLKVVACVYTNLDSMSHFFFHKHEIMEEYYSHLDKELNKVLKFTSDDDIVFLISDHGMKRTPPIKINFNSWLLKEGLLALKKARFKEPSYWLDKANINKSSIAGVLDRLHLLDWALKKVPEKVKQKADAILPPYLFIDWKHTKAYYTKPFAHSPFQGIEINLKGLKKEGIVNKGAEYENMRDKIIAKMGALKHGENSVVEWVKKREDVFPGKYCKEAPDIMFKLKDNYTGEINIEKKIFKRLKTTFTGEHSEFGILVAAGKKIKAGILQGKNKLIDLAPTFLSIFGITKPEDMDGNAIKAICYPIDYCSKRTKNVVEERTSKEKDKLNSIISKIKL